VLNGTDVNDETVKLIAQADSLKYLHLKETQISDASIPVFVNMRSLVELDVRETQLSQNSVQELTRSRPDLIVHWTSTNGDAALLGTCQGQRPE